MDVPFVSDYKQLLEGGKVDAVCIGLPSHMHHAVTLEALDAGRHVLCEKPPTETVEQILEVREKVSETGLVYQFVRQSRFGDMVQGLKTLIDSGKLGDIYYAKTEWIRGRWFSPKGWRHDGAKGGGVLLDLGIHAFDNVWFALGCPRPVEVMAVMNTTFSGYAPKEVVYTADDSTMAMIRFENGMLMNLEVAFSMNTLGMGKPVRLRSEISAEKDPEAPQNVEWQKIYVYGDKGAYEDNEFLEALEDGVVARELKGAPGNNPIARQVENFFFSIQGKEDPVNTVDHAVQLMQVLEGAKKSSESGKTIQLSR